MRRALRLAARTAALLLALGTVACGPEGRGDESDGGPDAPLDDLARVTGVVWAPGNALGQVSANHEIPVHNALISATPSPRAEHPAGAYCDQCEELPSGYSARSDPQGAFTLALPAGTYVLSIQKGQFRLDQPLVVEERQALPLPPEATTLPSSHAPAEGRWTPRLALATGANDDIQDILGKMGMGMVDEQGVLVGSALGDHIDYYLGGGGRADITSGNIGALVGSLETLLQYHIVFLPCGTSDAASALFADPQIRANLRAYVAAGGKLYVTDWSAEWMDVPYAPFVTFADHDTTSGDCVGVCEAGAGGTCCSNGDGVGVDDAAYLADHAKATDEGLAAWLTGQYGPVYVDLNTIGRGTIDASQFIVAGNWNRISALPTIDLGVDENGDPVSETARVYVTGNWTPGDAIERPLTVTFEPNGCGRILYSTYHTADTAHVGLLPQERVLLYLIMEIGECKEGPVID